MKNKNRERLRADSFTASKEISGDAALRAVLSFLHEKEDSSTGGFSLWTTRLPPLSLGWFKSAVQSSLTRSRMVAFILHQQELLDSICILWLLPKTHLISRCRSVSERVIISTKLPCCSLWQVCNPPPRYSFVPAVSVPEIWSGLKHARCALVYGQIRRRGFYYQGESLLILHIKVPGGNSVTCGKCKSFTENRSDLKRSRGIGKSVVKSKLCQPKSPGHITAGENQQSKLSTTLQ